MRVHRVPNTTQGGVVAPGCLIPAKKMSYSLGTQDFIALKLKVKGRTEDITQVDNGSVST